jgi:hypothetical protein
MIYSMASARRVERLNLVTIVFGLDWPTDQGQPVPASQLKSDIKLQAIASEIYRVKDFLERQLLAPVHLFDVRMGCIRVRYAVDGEVDRHLVGRALRSLLDNKEFYSVSNASGNVGGRSVEL